MTQETRIGLLVGLVFIVMFGIVLADMTKTNKTSSSQQVAVVTSDDGKAVLPVLPVVEEPTPIAVPKSDGGRPNPIVEASVSRPDAGETSTLTDAADTHTSAPAGDNTRAVAPGTDSGRSPTTPAASDATHTTVAVAAGVTYEVVAGDNPTKIAKKFYGPAHGGDFKKIMDANKVTSAAGLKVGMKLVIPDIPQAAAPARPAVAVTPVTPAPTTPSVAGLPSTGKPPVGAALSPTSRPATPAVAPLRTLPHDASLADLRTRFTPSAPTPAAAGPTTRPAPVSPALARVTTPVAPASPAAGSQKAYVVKPGDSLSKIARQNNTTITKLLSANKDTLDSPDDLQVGDTLTIPG